MARVHPVRTGRVGGIANRGTAGRQPAVSCLSLTIREPKRRRISAAPFSDRVVQRALCNVIEPVFEAQFIGDSYANRIGKSTQRAVARLQQFSRRFRYVLRLDIVQHFPAIDHAILLGTLAYLRHVDDFALFASDKQTLWRWKAALREFLAGLRLQFHEGSAQVQPVQSGIPWLGFVVFPTHRRVKARKVMQATRRRGDRFSAWQRSEISFAEFDASVQGWINHVRYADSGGLRRHVLEPFVF